METDHDAFMANAFGAEWAKGGVKDEPAAAVVVEEVAEAAAEVPEDVPGEAPEAEAEPVEGKKPDVRVPVGALQAERKKRQEIEARLAAAEEHNRAVAARLAEVLAARERPEAAAPAEKVPVRVEEDPLAYIEDTRARLEAMERERAVLAENQRVYAAYTADVERAKADLPDISDAETYLMNVLKETAKLEGHQNPEGWALDRAKMAVMSALQNGRSPATHVYSLARTFGYRGASPAVPAKTVAARAADVSARHQSLSDGSGGAVAGVLTADAVKRMPRDQFAEMMSDPQTRKAYERALLGG